MRGRPIRTLELAGSHETIGRTHGTAHAGEISRYAEDRIARSADGTTWTRAQVLDLAERCLPAHREYSPHLYAEMEAIAAASSLTPAEAMIVGGYTDFIDVVWAEAGSGPVEDTCTAVIAPVDEGRALSLAQTWDMHASATQHVVMLELAPEGRPRALIFSTVGCLGQIGLNDRGLAVGINNLTAADGRVGVTWPFVVRSVLEQSSFDDALQCILDAPLAGGHSFLLVAGDGKGAVVEAMPTTREVTAFDGEPLVHTNHCLLPGAQSVEGPRPAALELSSTRRLEDATRLLRTGPIDEHRLMEMTRDEASICRHPEPPFDYESCGAVVMKPSSGDFWACWGIPSENEFERFRLSQVEQV